MKIEDFDFELKPERIAQRPASPRDSSRLLVCQSRGRLGEFTEPFRFEDHVFSEVASDAPWALNANDLVITNDAKVLPVRLLGTRIKEGDPKPGGAVEILLLRRTTHLEWSAIMHMSAPARPGLKILFEPGLIAEVISTLEERAANDGEVRLKFSGLGIGDSETKFERWLERHGHIPLPPYIERTDAATDRADYQTVYAAKTGSAAAPTAGFHFTPELLARLDARGVQRASVTLHVGLGTFRPIKAERVEDHVMHEERFEISEEFCKTYAQAKADGRRIVAIGTTVVRTLDSWAAQAPGTAGTFSTKAFIFPGQRFRAVDDLITNFHLPRSTLLVLVSAAMSTESARAAYARALNGSYRFFSYGDAMFIRGSFEAFQI